MPTQVLSDKFKILFDHASDAHFILNELGVILDCNDAAVKLLGCRDRSQVLSIHPATLSPEFQPDGRRSAEKSVEMDAIALKNGYHRFEWTHRKIGGEEFPAEVTINAIEIDRRPSYIVVWHDLTEAKRAEKELQDLNDRMRRELEAAAEVQRSFLPEVPPSSDRFASAWFYKPCDELGGDGLNIFSIDGSRIGAYVLDVTGHGVASALTSVTVTHLLQGLSRVCCPHEVVERLNRHCAEGHHQHHSFTIVYGVLDLKERTFLYTSAGHAGPALVKKDGTTRQFDSHGIPVGMLGDVSYEQSRIALEPGDRLFLFSDGVYEARDARKDEWGLEGLHAHLKKEAINGYTLDYTVNSLARAAFHRTLPQKPDDDISIVGLEIK